MPISNLIDIRDKLPTIDANRDPDRPINAIARIVVHYDGVARPDHYDPIARYRGEAQYHLDKDWNPPHGVHGGSLMYAVKIDAWGNKYLCNNFERVLWHARIANYDGLAVCVDLGPGQDPTPAQLAALHSVLMDACYKCPEFPAGRANVWGHQEIRTNSTDCPGRLLSFVQRFRANKW